ncbi:MAG: VacJ family lipoprotein [Candidatus Gastranaerophilales bacterium]|nr:VacJ family lipoprotein [Candidatus Gastranaerophilales bacterium]
MKKIIIFILFFNLTANASTYWGDDVKPNNSDFIFNCIYQAYRNLEYPKRIISCFLQNDKDAMIFETKRFLINSTFGLYELVKIIL